MKKTFIAAALLMIVAGVANAQTKSTSSNVYGEIGWHNTELKVDGASQSPNLNVFTGFLGYQFHPNLSAEIFLATGASTANFGGGAEVKVDYGLGLAIRPSYKFNEKFEAFVRLGYGQYKVKASSSFGSDSDNLNSVLYGIGANYYFTDRVYGQLSYTNFYDKDGGKLEGFGASLGYKF